MLHFQINPHSGVPVYRQMVDQVKYYIASDVLKPGDQLPSIRELAQALSVNPTTVVRVYSELEREAVIEMRHGKGAFVAAHARRWNAQQRTGVLRKLARHLAVEATQLGASVDEVVEAVRQEMAELQAESGVEEPARISVIARR